MGLYSAGLLSCVGGVCVGDEQYAEGAGDGLPPPGSPYYLTDPSQLWYIHTVTPGARRASLALDSSAHIILNSQEKHIRRGIADISQLTFSFLGIADEQSHISDFIHKSEIIYCDSDFYRNSEIILQLTLFINLRLYIAILTFIVILSLYIAILTLFM